VRSEKQETALCSYSPAAPNAEYLGIASFPPKPATYFSPNLGFMNCLALDVLLELGR